MIEKKLKSPFGSIRKKIKDIVTLASKENKKANIEKIHAIALDLLINVIETEGELLGGFVAPSSSEKPAKTSKQKTQKKTKKQKTAKVTTEKSPVSIESEIAKVNKRLPKWVNAQNQFNAQILTAYLKLAEKNNTDYLYESDLADEFEDKKKFKLNYNTMKVIAKNNNGKLFDVIDKKIYIWEPIKDAVATYKERVLN